jgi:hypothetical protein
MTGEIASGIIYCKGFVHPLVLKLIRNIKYNTGIGNIK